ncbi:putative nicotinate-nucleotide adenylyltransferase [Primorskyibacter flagellatus]|uniref:Probable nicotinate-nucleotide adenylyltransferase n=2 Tax=Primorskyibacter flagellatus TaxID=1387277 RepID=A0A917A9T3_9RHOB|nr:putative nicotinate-nucleotide adenylyltransferase [Primorskyibacter flagellatus]
MHNPLESQRPSATTGPMRDDMPRATPSQVIGLLGGSFDPAHDGHVHLTREAIKRFGLTYVWWLVSPGNPLKSRQPATMEARIARARDEMRDPRVTVTGIEEQLGTRYTAETLAALSRLYPGVRFVWLMGADNLTQLDQWQDWHWIMENIPVGVLARPGYRISACTSKAARLYARYRLPANASRLLGRSGAPAWCFVNMPMMPHSSTQIRKDGAWTRTGEPTSPAP